MKPLALLGVLVAVIGAVIVFRGVIVKDREDIVRVGDVRITAESRERVPAWIGAAAIVGGLAMVVAGTRKR